MTTYTMTYEMLSAFVNGLTGWDENELERAVCMVMDAQADVGLFGDDVRSLTQDGEVRIQRLDPMRVAYLRILDSAGLRRELEPYLEEGQRGWDFNLDSDEAYRIMSAVPSDRRCGAWHWLWEKTTASWSPLAEDEEEPVSIAG